MGLQYGIKVFISILLTSEWFGIYAAAIAVPLGIDYSKLKMS
jgi:hypothetical protein